MITEKEIEFLRALFVEILKEYPEVNFILFPRRDKKNLRQKIEPRIFNIEK